MVFLPIVERELRVAARKPGTIGWRVLAALVALVLGAAFLGLSRAMGVSTVGFGRALFGTLTWLTLGVALAAGLFFTADSLSQEKRDGTLGFLFLTDLGGFDVVGGKLAATSLRSSFALLAVFPILAVTLLMGGVTGAQFWQTCLALVNALFGSLVAGLLVSSVSRDAQRALAATFVLLVLLCAAGPIADAMRMGVRGKSFQPLLSFTSPAYVFWAASAWGKSGYWTGLLTSHLMAWACLVCAGVLVRRTWQDRPLKLGSHALFRSRSHAGPRRSRKLLDPNPVAWLSIRGRRHSIGVWLIAVLAICALGAMVAMRQSMVWMVWGQLNWILLMGLYLWAASQGSGFLVDARRSGLLELLLVTPLSGAQVIAGQWRGLLRAFGCPIGLLVLVMAVGAAASQGVSRGMMPSGSGAPALGLVAAGLLGMANGLMLAANIVTLVWVGMWMGLSSKNSGLAALKTLLFVQFLPWLVISFASVLISGLLLASSFIQAGFAGGAPSATALVTFPLILSGVTALLTFVKDAAFISWARAQLKTRFREQATQSFERTVRVPPPVQPRIPAPPPLQV